MQQTTKLKVFFADPYCAWQRGPNENTNGLLRRYFPEGTDFSKVSDEQFAGVVDTLNNRPRKCLAYRTPLESFYALLAVQFSEVESTRHVTLLLGRDRT